MTPLNIEITEVENGYIIAENNPDKSHLLRKVWVASYIEQLIVIIQELAKGDISKQRRSDDPT